MMIIGLLLSLCILAIGAYKGWHIFPLSILGSLIIVVFNGMNPWTALATSYASGWMSWAGGYFLVFALGALFGELMVTSGAAKSIAYSISDLIGAKRAPIAIVAITMLLTYGGVNLFVVVFTIYPLAMVMCKEGNIPRSLAIASTVLGAATATMSALPGTPSTQNLVPTGYLGTNTFAAPTIGIVCSVMMIGLGLVYIIFVQRKYAAKGIGFTALPQDGLGDGTSVRDEVPHFVLCLVPLASVICCIFFTQGKLDAMLSVCLGLTLGCVLTVLLFWKRLGNKKAIINKGFSSSITPLMNTAAVIGYGAVIQASPAFQEIIGLVQSINVDPYVTTAVGVSVLSGIIGSATGALKVFLESMGAFLLESGANPGALHRVASIASGSLGALPQTGAVVSMLAIFGSNHKESYRHVFVVGCLISLAATVVAVCMALLMYPV